MNRIWIGEVKRGRVALHEPDLDRRGMGAQQGGGFALGGLQIKGVEVFAGGVVRRDVERLEVVELRLHLRPLHGGEAEPLEDLQDPVHRLRERMEPSCGRQVTRQREIQLRLIRDRSRLDRNGPLREGLLETAFHFVELGP